MSLEIIFITEIYEALEKDIDELFVLIMNYPKTAELVLKNICSFATEKSLSKYNC